MSAPARQSRTVQRGEKRLNGGRTLQGATGVAELQRSRMLNSAVQVVTERGYGQMSVSRVTGRAGVSRRTFYELFDDREACFLAAFDHAVNEMRSCASAAWCAQGSWQKRMRAGLAAVLSYLEGNPGLGALVIVEALGAGPRVLTHRTRVLEQLAALVDEGRMQSGVRRQPPPLTAEGLVGAVLGVLHARLLEGSAKPLTELLNPLMAIVISPYLGQARGVRELERPLPAVPARVTHISNPLHGLNIRLTNRTVKVLTSIASFPDASNRQIADHAGVADQGQISKLLARLQRKGLIRNTAPAQPTGEPNRWRLTARGMELQQAIQAQAAPAPAVAAANSMLCNPINIFEGDQI